jgi:hypothetical protein
MKEPKRNVKMQELSKEEATNTYGGKRCIAMVVAEGGKIALVVVER